nr:EAL domain-containing protein [Acinetobacter sp. Marseille-Q1620]
MHRKQRQYSQFIINNQILQNNAAQYLESSRKLSEQLSISSLRSKEIENELQLNNQLLEQKVKSRTYDIEQMNIRLENHRQNLALAHEAAGIHSWVWNIEKRTIEFLGSELNKLFYQKTYHTHKTKSIIHPDDLNTYNTLMRAHLRGFSDHFECSYRVKVQEQWIWFHDTGRVVSRNSQNKKPLRMVGIRRNIQKEKNDQEQLRLAANVFDQVAEGVFVLDHNLCFVEVNPYFEKLTGLDQKQILGKHLFDITKNNCTDTINYHTTMYQRLIQTDEYDAEATEEFISGKKISIWTHINAVRDEKNKVIHYVGIVTDLTERKKQELRLSYLENYDTLTDLPNRLYFNNQLHQYLSDSLHSLKHLAVIRVNIDRFRFFNEYLSNHAGDELLKQVAGRLRQANPQALLISHLNNDDFAIIYNLNNYSVKQHCQNILQALNKPFYINLQEHFITVSIGVALYPEHGRQIDSLNIHAEQALAEAKQLGGNTIRLYSHKASPLLNSSINLDRDLRQAIKNKELIVYYQPKISLTSKKVYGFEALIRWNHPVRGLIAPDTFLPFAEESSLISEIGYFVLLETCKQIKSWINHGFPDISVSVNIVAQQIHRGRLLTDLKEALELYNIDGHHLELEITESSLIDHSKNVEKLLEQIKKENISISLDDFGTGYSSLAYLTRYPFDTLKIDRAFVNKIGDHKDEAIITAMIAMGKAMGMNIVAEGVETIEQVNFLKHQGCDILQGFYFSKPLNALESTEFLKQHKLIAV